jgi:hypothetical protein
MIIRTEPPGGRDQTGGVIIVAFGWLPDPDRPRRARIVHATVSVVPLWRSHDYNTDNPGECGRRAAREIPQISLIFSCLMTDIMDDYAKASEIVETLVAVVETVPRSVQEHDSHRIAQQQFSQEKD